MRKKIIDVGGIIVIIGLASVLLGKDFAHFVQWWGILLMLGILFLPVTSLLFERFHDKGYLFSKVIGIAVTGYVVWLLSSLHVMKFTGITCWIGLLLVAIPNIIIIWYEKSGKKQPWLGLTKKETSRIEVFLEEEMFFLMLFLVWCYIKGFKPQAYGTEKFMDYGFMTSMMRADYMPPSDPWYAGGQINYYYFGQYLATFLTKLSHVSVNNGHNLMLMMIAAFSTVLPYSIIYNVTKVMCEKKGKKHNLVSQLAGLCAGALVTCSGNLHFVLYKYVVPTLRNILEIKGEYGSYWFPDSTRYIGYNPETKDKTIHEFPSYSIVLGDLHAHVINIIFVLTVIGLLFAWLIYQDHRRWNEKIEVKNKLSNYEWKREVFNPNIVMITFFIGIFHMTNYWDYPIYYVVAGAIILFTNAINYKFHIKTIIMTAFQGLVVLLGSKVIALPFTLNFDKISNSICLSQDHTPLYQLIILWGFPIIVIVGFIMSCIHDNIKQKDSKDTKKERVWDRIKSFLNGISCTDLFIILLGLCAIGLVLMPEIIYVEDIYSGSYKRANTMFKLTYQAYIMFCICSGYIFIKLIAFKTTQKQRKYAIFGLILALVTCNYVLHSTNRWFGNITDRSCRKNLDSAAFMDTSMPEDAKAIKWLNDNVKGQPVILEAHGDSYSDYERISVMTGLQTVLGWYVHEQLWRSEVDELNVRRTDIETIYTSTNEEEVMNLIELYDIDYIYVGKLEYEKYKAINTNLLKSFGEVVYSNASDIQQSEETYIVQISR